MRLLFALFCVVAVIGLTSFQPRSSSFVAPPGDTLRIIGVGDIMLGTNYPNTGYLPPKSNENILVGVREILQKADLTFGNLEGILLDKGGSVKRCSDPSKCYAFRMPERYARYLLDAGFDMLSMANNHSGDFGPKGRERTQELLDSLNIGTAGLLTDPETIVVRHGVRYGMVAFAPNSGTCDIRNIPKAVEMVRDLSTRCDIVIVSFHGGAEGKSRQHVPKATETFYGENRGNVHAFSRAVVDAGADIVFGHGPHVTRAMEIYNDRLIAYSLGNFATYGRFNISGVSGLAPLLDVAVDREGRFLEAQITPIIQVGEGIPQVDPAKTVIPTLRALCEADYPETSPLISDDGRLTKRP